MEVSTVSPSPASPTEGDNLCETDVTTVAIHSVTLLICLSRLAGNGVVLWLLGSHTSSKNSIILYNLTLTLLDFLLILLPSTLLLPVEDMSCSIIVALSYIGFLSWMSLLSHSMWLCTLTFISIRRCRSIHCLLWHCCHHPQHLLMVMLALLRDFFITLVIVFAMILSLCMFQQSEHCWVFLSSIYTFNLLLCAPFMLIYSTILYSFKPCSRQQQPKRLNIVICLIVLFTLPHSLCNFLQQLGYTVMPSQVVLLLAYIHSSIKPFICFLVGKCWRPCFVGSLRLSLQRVFEEPEENTAHSHDPAMETLLSDHGTVAERFLESPDRHLKCHTLCAAASPAPFQAALGSDPCLEQPGATSHCLPSIHPSMEVSTVSPVFTSPTDTPAQCEINVSNMAIDFVTLLVGLCGLAGNGVVLWFLHVNAITHFISKQANIDFLFLIFMLPSTLLFLVEEVSCSAIMPLMYLSLLFQLSLFTYIIGLYRLMFISIQRCRSVLCLVFCGCQLSEHLLWVLMTPLFWVLLFIFVGVNPTVTSHCQSHEQEQCQVAVTSTYALNLFLFAVPMVISSTILFIHLKPGSQQQQQHKRLDIVIFLIALFSLPLSVCFLLHQLGYTVVTSQALFLLACTNSSIKPFICFLVGSWKRDCSMGSCWRHCSMESCRKHSSIQSLRKAIHRVFGEPEEDTARGGEPVVNTVI
ncbi:LOW QUALITY PROTEIN: uncharacterized protein GJ701_006302 [Geothlypis trichas]